MKSPTALALLFLAGCHAAPGSADEKPREQSAAVAVAKVDVGAVEKTVSTFGSVEFAADQQRTLPFVKAGQVNAVLVVSGQVVRKGDPLLSFGGVPQGAPEMQQAVINVDYAARELGRVQRLVTENLATNQDQQAAAKSLSAAQARLRGLGGGDVGVASMRAASDGVVAEVLVRRGDVVQAGQPAVVVVGRDALTVKAGFEVEDLAVLREGLTVRVTPVFNGEKAASAAGTLAALHRVVNSTTQLVEGLVRIDAPASWMAAGLLVKITAVIESRDKAVRVPNEALVNEAGTPGVFVVAGGVARFRAIGLGIADETRQEVKSGLSAGDTVVTVGRTSLSDGMAVRVNGSAP